MKSSDIEGFVRLAVGLALDVCLWPVIRELGMWSSYDREIRLALLSGSLAAAAVVSVIPLFWRGKAWQAPIAFVLLWLPAIAVYGILSIVVHQI